MLRFVLGIFLGSCLFGSAHAETPTDPVRTSALARLSSMAEEIEEAEKLNLLDAEKAVAARELVLSLAKQRDPDITLEGLRTFNEVQRRQTLIQGAYALGAFTLAAAILTLIYLLYGSNALEGLGYLSALLLIRDGGRLLPFGEIAATLCALTILSVALMWRLDRWRKAKILPQEALKPIIGGLITASWGVFAVVHNSSLLGGVAVVCFLLWLLECVLFNALSVALRGRYSDHPHIITSAGLIVALGGVAAHRAEIIPADMQWLVSPFAYTALRLGAAVCLGNLVALAWFDYKTRAYDIQFIAAALLCLAAGSAGLPALAGIASWTIVAWAIGKIGQVDAGEWGVFVKFAGISLLCWGVGKAVQTWPQIFAAL